MWQVVYPNVSVQLVKSFITENSPSRGIEHHYTDEIFAVFQVNKKVVFRLSHSQLF
jgi:hypothetical protein